MAYKIRLNGTTHSVNTKDTAILLAVLGLRAGMGDKMLGARIGYVNIYYDSITKPPKYTAWVNYGMTDPVYVSDANNWEKALYVWSWGNLHKADEQTIKSAKISYNLLTRSR